MRKFVKNEILPVELKIDPDATEFPPEDVARLQEKTRAMGMFAPGVPEEYGGGGLDFFSRIILSEEISKHRQGLYNPEGGFRGECESAPLLGKRRSDRAIPQTLCAGLKARLLCHYRGLGGIDPAMAIRTRAVKKPEGWVINGTKFWITHADKSDFVIVFVRTDNGPVGTRGEITCFIVDKGTPGYTVSKPIPVTRPDWPYELIFEDWYLFYEHALRIVSRPS